MTEVMHPAPENGESATSEASFPSSQGVTLRALCIDEFGVEVVTVSHTTMSPRLFQEKGAVIRQAVDAFYSSLGMQMLSLTQEFEAEVVVISQEAEQAPAEKRHLRLVCDNGKRIMSPDVACLMRSAGMTEAEARCRLYGEKP